MAGIIYGLVKLGDSAEIVIDRFSHDVGIGLILTMISAIILFIDQPKVQAFADKEKDQFKTIKKKQIRTI